MQAAARKVSAPTRSDITSRVDRAGDELRKKFPNGGYKPADIIALADRFDLPIGREADVAKSPVARTIVIAAYSREATQALEQGYDAVMKLFDVPSNK